METNWAFFLCSVGKKKACLIVYLTPCSHLCWEQSLCSGFQHIQPTPQLQLNSPGVLTNPGSQVRPQTLSQYMVEPGILDSGTETLCPARDPYSLWFAPIPGTEPLFWIPNQSANTPVAAQPPRGSDTSRITGSQEGQFPEFHSPPYPNVTKRELVS